MSIRVELRAANVTSHAAVRTKLVKTMRASFVVLGPAAGADGTRAGCHPPEENARSVRVPVNLHIVGIRGARQQDPVSSRLRRSSRREADRRAHLA